MTDGLNLNNLVDRSLKCVDCNKNFIFGAGEQRFFKSKGLRDPKRCNDCRRFRKATLAPEVRR